MGASAAGRVLLEVAVASAEDAVAAARGGADRLELNAALSLGGLTPSLGCLVEAKQATRLPIWAMVRPRPGGFAYSEAEFRTMRRDADYLMERGADGVAFGFLNADGTVDAPRCREMVRQVGGERCVFHRAFDVTPDPFAALEALIDLGFRRLMTSGQEKTAYEGSILIADLIRKAEGWIEVLPAGGINRFTVADVVIRTECSQVHASLRERRTDASTAARPQVAFGDTGPEDGYDATDLEAVAEMRVLLQRDEDAD
jgi:copper homeostasis protein